MNTDNLLTGFAALEIGVIILMNEEEHAQARHRKYCNFEVHENLVITFTIHRFCLKCNSVQPASR